MKFGSIQITKRMKEGHCDHCDRPLELGVHHATITIRATAKKSGKHWFANWHLHVQCLSMWLAMQLVARQDRRKAAGRPKGTGLKVPPEDKKKRLALLKRRTRLFREIALQDYHSKELAILYNRFATIEEAINELGGPAKVNKRTTIILPDIEKKLLYGRSLDGQARAG